MFGIFSGASTSEGEQQAQPTFDLWSLQSLAEKAKASLAVAVNSVSEVAQTIKDTNWNQELSSFSEGVKEDAERNLTHNTDVPQSSEPVEKVIGNIGQELNQFGLTLLAGTKDMIEQLREGIDDEIATAAKQQRKKPNKTATVSAGPLSLGSPKLEKAAYSRYESEVATLQRDTNTYLDDPEEFREEFGAFKASFSLQKSKSDINQLLVNSFMSDLHSRIVPDVVEEEEFWSRYFFKVHKLRQREDQRAQLTLRMASGLTSTQQEEEPWDEAEDPPPPPPPLQMDEDLEAAKNDDKPDHVDVDHVMEVAEPEDHSSADCPDTGGDRVVDAAGPALAEPAQATDSQQPELATLRKSTIYSDDSFKSWERIEPPEPPEVNQPEEPLDQKLEEVSKDDTVTEKKSERTTETTPGLAAKDGSKKDEGDDWSDWD